MSRMYCSRMLMRTSGGDNAVDVMNLIFSALSAGRSLLWRDKQISQAVSVYICPVNVKARVGEGHNSQKVDGINLVMAQ